MNRDAIVSAVRDMVQRPSLQESLILVAMQSAQGEMNRVLRDHPRNRVRGAYATTVADSPELPLPVDLAKLISLTDEYGNRYTQYPATVTPTDTYAFQERGDCLHLYPTPAIGTTFTLDYNAFLLDLEDGASSNWVSKYFPDLYLYGALKELAVMLKMPQQLAGWSAEFQRRLEETRIQGWNQNMGASPRVRLG